MKFTGSCESYRLQMRRSDKISPDKIPFMLSRKKRLKRRIERWRASVAASLLVVMSLTGGGCFLDHDVEQYYGKAIAPRAQEFRWSDGGLPRVFDPALAAAAPDTDAVRALYEGLTEYDPKTLAPTPGVASRWESSADASARALLAC